MQSVILLVPHSKNVSAAALLSIEIYEQGSNLLVYLFLEEFDTYDPKANQFLKLPFLRKRSKIVEIVTAHDMVFALAFSGVCAAFSRETKRRICYLNICPVEVIRSLFYNKNNDSLITVSVYASDNFSSLKCRTTPIEYVRRGQPDAGFPLFELESLRWPGFVEFDDVNGKVLTYSAQDRIYKVFDLKNYNLLYSISGENVQEIKIRASGHVPLKIVSIEDGTVLKSFNHLLHRNKKVDFIEQFNEKLLVKQENENLQILDVRSSQLTEANPDNSSNEEAGKRCVTTDQAWLKLFEMGSINISNILTGKCLAKVRADDPNVGISACYRSNSSTIQSTVNEALEDVTALCYDEERNEIYTGNRQGLGSMQHSLRADMPYQSTAWQLGLPEVFVSAVVFFTHLMLLMYLLVWHNSPGHSCFNKITRIVTCWFRMTSFAIIESIFMLHPTLVFFLQGWVWIDSRAIYFQVVGSAISEISEETTILCNNSTVSDLVMNNVLFIEGFVRVILVLYGGCLMSEVSPFLLWSSMEEV
eukprot:Gb_11511 [translate_table: standard]